MEIEAKAICFDSLRADHMLRPVLVEKKREPDISYVGSARNRVLCFFYLSI